MSQSGWYKYNSANPANDLRLKGILQSIYFDGLLKEKELPIDWQSSDDLKEITPYEIYSHPLFGKPLIGESVNGEGELFIVYQDDVRVVTFCLMQNGVNFQLQKYRIDLANVPDGSC